MPALIHHPHMRGKIGEQRIEPVIGISIFVEAKFRSALALYQLGRCIVMLKIHEHFSYSVRPVCACTDCRRLPYTSRKSGRSVADHLVSFVEPFLTVGKLGSIEVEHEKPKGR